MIYQKQVRMQHRVQIYSNESGSAPKLFKEDESAPIVAVDQGTKRGR